MKRKTKTKPPNPGDILELVGIGTGGATIEVMEPVLNPDWTINARILTYQEGRPSNDKRILTWGGWEKWPKIGHNGPVLVEDTRDYLNAVTGG